MRRNCRTSARRPSRVLLSLTTLALLVCLATKAPAEQEAEVYYIRIDGMITAAYQEAVQRKIEHAREQGGKIVILQLNTPGGTLGASMDLSDFIFKQQDLQVIAYINEKAYSGGTMVALACDRIFIDATVGMMGDVAPVGPSGEILSEKLQSPIREKMASYARKRGYPVPLVQAMVTKELAVYSVKFRSGEQSYLTADELGAMTKEQQDEIEDKKIIVPAGHLLSLAAGQAVKYGFATAVGSKLQMYDLLGIEPGEVTRLPLSRSEMVLTWLDAISPLLIMAGLILLYIEFSNPGFGLPGILGIACFATLFAVKYSLHYAQLFEILLFVGGVGFLLVELFLIPGFGIVGITGILLIIGSLVLMFQQFTLPETSLEGAAFASNILQVLGAFVLSGVGIALLARFMPALPLLGRMIHREDLAAASVGSSMEERQPGIEEMMGEVGVALTALRPAGRAEFGETLLDVVTEGDFIEQGARVRIESIHGNRFVVKEVTKT